VPKPDPQVGLVVRFEYIWQSQDQASKGDKRRPCIIILAVAATDDTPAKAMVCPITHSAPRYGDIGLAIADEEKRLMGLDPDDQWVIVSEANLFPWNDSGLVQLADGSWTYGVTPRDLLERVRTRYRAVYGERGPDAVTNRL
jgi:hypothetical protein